MLIMLCFCLAVGKTCNYVIVMAGLYSKGKFHGIYPFIAQIRDLTSHMPLPGMENSQLLFVSFRLFVILLAVRSLTYFLKTTVSFLWLWICQNHLLISPLECF